MKSPQNRNLAHSELLAATLRRLRELGVVVFQRNVGAAVAAGRFVRYGVSGQFDIWGAVPGTARLIEVECKTGGGVLTKNQIAWQEFCVKLGAIVFVVRDVSEIGQKLSAQMSTADACGVAKMMAERGGHPTLNQ